MTDSHTDTNLSVSQRTLGDYLRVLQRRKWLVLGLTVLVTATSVALSLGESRVFRGTAQVLLNRSDLAATATGAAVDPTLGEDPARFATTQAALARSAAVATLALRNAHESQRSVGDFLLNSTVTPNPNADLLVITVDDLDARKAQTLANAYADAYARYKLQLDTTALQRARTELNTRIGALKAQGDQQSALYRSLVNSEQQLHTMQLLQSEDTVFTHNGVGVQVKPTPKRNAALGIGFGLLLGLAAAFISEALDKRIKSEDEIERELALPLLARIPEPPRRLREKLELTMIAEPMGIHAEAVWRLATNIEFMNPDGASQVIMITSSVPREGKSTTIANLAVALARSGRRVALVDLDLRQPTLASLFDIHRRVGLTDVVMRRQSLDQALIQIRLPGAAGQSGGPVDSSASDKGWLVVLPTGPLPPTPSEFVGTDALVRRVLDPLREQFDYVLIDAPPMGIVGDAAKLSLHVDSLLVVARLGVVDRSGLLDFKRQLTASPATPSGFVMTGVTGLNPYAYGAYFDNDQSSVGVESPQEAAAAPTTATPRRTPRQRSRARQPQHQARPSSDT
jgi:polysaccharide biosynthesis transport protein